MILNNKKDLMRYVGDTNQVYGIKDYLLNEGKSKGLRCFDIVNGSGLEFSVLPDRGMDILQVKKDGMNLAYRSKASLSSPHYYDPSPEGFYKNFFAGFLTTCGPSNVGLSSIHNGRNYDMHGLWSMTPAVQVYGILDERIPEPAIRVGGQLRYSRLFGENLLVTREISCPLFSNKIRISDFIENQSFNSEPLFLLYHFNLGYPLLQENTTLLIDSCSIQPRTKEAEAGLTDVLNMQPPTENYKEQVFYHDIKADDQGYSRVQVENTQIGIGLQLKYLKQSLPQFIQWKQMGLGEYALGIEPSNCQLAGRAEEILHSNVELLEPWSKKEVSIEIEVYGI